MAVGLTQSLGQGQKWGSVPSQCFFSHFGANEPVSQNHILFLPQAPAAEKCLCLPIGTILTHSQGCGWGPGLHHCVAGPWPTSQPKGSKSKGFMPKAVSDLRSAKHTQEEAVHPALHGTLPISTRSEVTAFCKHPRNSQMWENSVLFPENTVLLLTFPGTSWCVSLAA